VPLSVFVQDKKYLANPPLSDEQYEAVRHIEKVYLPETYRLLASSADREVRNYWSAPCRMVNLVTLEWGLTRQRKRQGPHLPDRGAADRLPGAVPAEPAGLLRHARAGHHQPAERGQLGAAGQPGVLRPD